MEGIRWSSDAPAHGRGVRLVVLGAVVLLGLGAPSADALRRPVVSSRRTVSAKRLGHAREPTGMMPASNPVDVNPGPGGVNRAKLAVAAVGLGLTVALGSPDAAQAGFGAPGGAVSSAPPARPLSADDLSRLGSTKFRQVGEALQPRKIEGLLDDMEEKAKSLSDLIDELQVLQKASRNTGAELSVPDVDSYLKSLLERQEKLRSDLERDRQVRDQLRRRKEVLEALEAQPEWFNYAAALAASVLSTAVMHPIDTVKTRMMAVNPEEEAEEGNGMDGGVGGIGAMGSGVPEGEAASLCAEDVAPSAPVVTGSAFVGESNSFWTNDGWESPAIRTFTSSPPEGHWAEAEGQAEAAAASGLAVGYADEGEEDRAKEGAWAPPAEHGSLHSEWASRDAVDAPSPSGCTCPDTAKCEEIVEQAAYAEEEEGEEEEREPDVSEQYGLGGDKVLASRGIAGLYEGILGNVLKEGPSSALYLGVYESTKAQLRTTVLNANPLLVYLVCGAMGELVGSTVRAPMEAVKSNVQSGTDHSTWASAQRVIGTKDGRDNILRAWSASLWRDVPFGAVQLAVFELLKSYILNSPHITLDVNTLVSEALIGAIGGATGAFISTPADVITTRIITQKVAEGETPVALPDMARRVWSEGQLPALFRGCRERVLYWAPAIGIFLSCYCSIRQLGISWFEN